MVKKSLLTAAGVLMLSVIFCEAFGQTIVINEYDELTGNRRIFSSTESILHEGFRGSAAVEVRFGRIKVDSLAYYESYTMGLEVSSLDGFQLFPSGSAYFVIDDERAQYELNRGKVERRGEVAFESSYLRLNKADFERFGKAADLRFSIGGDVYTVTQNAKDAFLLVFNKLQD